MYSNNKWKFLLLNFALIFATSFSLAQNKEISVKFIGNCGLGMTDGTTNIYFDFPYKSGAHHYMEYNLAELDSVKSNAIFIYTHKHSDHYTGLVKKIAKKRNGRIFTPQNVDQLLKLNGELKDFKIETFHTKHRFSFNHYSYLLTWHGKRIFISGDTENVETLAALKEIDWAFIPAWLLMDAIEKKVKLKQTIQKIVIYHIGPRDNITSDADDKQIKLLDKQGEIFSI